MTQPIPATTPMIYPAMAAIMAEIPAIGKDKKNVTQNFNYRGIDDVYNALNSVMGKHGVFMCPEVLEQNREERTSKNGTVLAFVTLRVKYLFYAQDGSNVACVVCGEGMDSGDKATNKAMSIAQKYAFFQVFAIPTKEVLDPDADTHEVKPKRGQGKGNGAAAPQPTSGPTEQQRKAFFAAIHEALPWLKGDRELILQTLSLAFGRELSSSSELSSGEISNIISDPKVLLEFAPTAKEYETIKKGRATPEAKKAEDAPEHDISHETLKAVEAELSRLGAPGQLPPDVTAEYGTGDPSELTEPQGQQTLIYLKSMAA